MKKILLSICAVFLLLGITGCTKEKNIEGTLEELMTKVYADVPEEERPMALVNTPVTKENVEGYLGTSDIEFQEGLASESMIGSVAHSIVLLRVDDNKIEEVKAKIQDNVNPHKWICVEAEETKVLNKGNLIILIMSSKENASKIENSFNNLN